jgi:5-methylcytosine-specific restriction endonuclease McrA
MRKLTPLKYKLYNYFEDIVESKNDSASKVLLSIKSQVSDRYEEYQKNFNETDLIKVNDSPFEKNHVQLISCYKSETNKVKELKKKIRKKQSKEQKGLCQYCCIGKPKTFDHYLPISEYPEFSVLAINLLPCCTDCNEKKKSYWKENSERGIINFYVDNISEKQFLFAKIKLRRNVPYIKFEIQNEKNQIDINLFRTIELHFRRLNLIELYNEESNDELEEMIRQFKIYLKGKNTYSLKEDILEDAKQLINKYGNNYWKTVMKSTLANSDEFMTYISNSL